MNARSSFGKPLFAGLVLLVSVSTVWGAVPKIEGDPMDWPNWRGPEHNGMSREVGLVDSWSPDGENLLWKNEELGGRSTPIVMRGKLYNIVSADPGTPIEGEKVVCVDAATGKKIWENKFKVFNSDVPAERVGWSSVVGDPETGNVYAQGVCGLFLCLDGETGKTIWSRSLTEEYGLLTTYGGRTNVPVVFDDLVIISGVMIGWGEHARPNHRYIAFDKKDGTPVWFNATRPLPDDTTYSTPVLAIVNGEAQLIGGTGDGNIYSIQPRTGKILWNYTLSLRGLNVTPLVVGNTVYVSQSEENPDAATMGAFVAIDATGQGDVTKSKEVWREKELMIGKSSPVIVNGLIYSIDDGGGIFVIDSKTGKVIKKQKLGTMMRSSPLYADGKIYTCDATGRWYILKPTPKGFDVIHKLRLRSESHGSPIVSHGRIYIPMLDAMYCIGKSDAKPSVSGAPDFAEEAPVSADPKPAQLQIVPVEALLKPGQQQKFVARLFNSKGQFVGNADKVKFTTDAKAPIQKEDKSDGVPGLVLGAAKDQKAHQGITITAEAEGLKSTARARLFPDLPWKFDFADGNVPLPWVGARYRHVVRDLNGEKVMVKVTTIPKGTRSIASFGPVDLHDYTIQADVRGQSVGGKLPDIGLTAQRYTLELMGASQQLRIFDWPPVLRNVKSIPYAWKPDVWYTMKLRASNENGKAVLKGKIWERNTPEPSEWTLEVVDELPSTEGSPGLYGNAKDAEIYLDNISVTKN